jgi:hypothetical protein
MKMTKLSLIAAMAISTAFAGGDIAPVEPVVEAPVASSTTIDGKLVAYYITDSSVDLFDEDSSALGTAVTLDVSHKFNDMFTANFSAVGYANLMDNYLDVTETGAYFNVANLTATFGDTTLVAGRQLLGTPMLQGYDWLLAPGAFESYTLVNSSIENVTLIAAYVAKYRPNNAGDNWIDLTDIGDGDNWTVSASYASDAFNASAWYYNVDAGMYTQVYVDAGTTFSGVDVAAQYVETDYDLMADSTAYGIKVSGTASDIELAAAYNKVEDNFVGYVDWNALYTNSWNTTAANVGGDSFMVSASTEFSGLSATASYAHYEYEQFTESGHEFDLILGYGITDDISLDVIYSNTNYSAYSAFEDIDQLEIIATYKF